MTYKVIGSQPVFNTAPGDTFEADLSPDKEQFLIAVGHIERITPDKDFTNLEERASGKPIKSKVFRR